MCPLKSGPLPSAISVSQCKHLHTSNPTKCRELVCHNHVRAAKEVEFLRKHSDGVDLMFGGKGSGAEDAPSNTP